MIGGTSRAVVEEVVEVAGVERGCDMVVEEDEVDAVTGEEGATSG
jgi:hypothetical protein